MPKRRRVEDGDVEDEDEDEILGDVQTENDEEADYEPPPPQPIRRLDQLLVNRIAAGEVR